MSKVSEAKARQHYTDKPAQPICANCKHYSSRTETFHSRFSGTYSKEKDKRCTLGNFAVKKTATCMRWEEKV